MRQEFRGRKPLFDGNLRVQRAYWDIQKECGVAVTRAIRTGLLRPAKEFSCVDCGAPAYGWDHRDYRKPLDVEAVCRSHNALRGVAEPFRGFL